MTANGADKLTTYAGIATGFKEVNPFITYAVTITNPLYGVLIIFALSTSSIIILRKNKKVLWVLGSLSVLVTISNIFVLRGVV